MAKIIIPPPEREWKKQITCYGCQAIIELEPSDLTFSEDQREGVWYSWTCPVSQCQHRQAFSARDEPDWLRQLVMHLRFGTGGGPGA